MLEVGPPDDGGGETGVGVGTPEALGSGAEYFPNSAQPGCGSIGLTALPASTPDSAPLSVGVVDGPATRYALVVPNWSIILSKD